MTLFHECNFSRKYLRLRWILNMAYRYGSLRWRHNDHAGVSNHQPHGCLLNRLFRRKSKKTSKLRVTGLCAGNSPGTGEFPAQMASYAENVSIWWRHHGPFVSSLLLQMLCHLMMTPSNGNIFRVTGPFCGNSPVTGEFPSQRPVARSLNVFFDLRLNKLLSKQSRG